MNLESMNEDKILLKTQTFLAPNIKYLYDNYSSCDKLCCKEKEMYDDSFNAQEFLCKWDLSSLNLDGLTEDSLSEEWISKGLKSILPLLKDISLLITSSGLRHLALEWTGMNSVLQEAVGRLTESSVVHHYIALLQVSAATERILGQVFLLKGMKVPFLLRDLLNTEELRELLGKELVNFLKILTGSVFGLNIRNLAWHGFLGIHDIHCEHAALILFALHRCEEQLCKRNLKICPPSCMDLEKVFSLLDKNTKKFAGEEGDSLEIVLSSPFVHAIMQPFWEVVVILISQREKIALLLMLPLLENALRVLYALVNSRPFSAILTATDSAFYVTMDEILHPWMTTPIEQKPGRTQANDGNVVDSAPLGQNPNLVPLFLGRQLTEAFCDLFHHTVGPRLRDRVSHGEIAYGDVPFETVGHLFRLCLLTLSAPRWRFLEKDQQDQFSIKCGCAKVQITTILRHECHFHYSNEAEVSLSEGHSNPLPLEPCNSYLISYISTYEGSFHPSSLLKQSLFELISDLERWELWGRARAPHLFPESHNDWESTREVASEWSLPFASYTFKRRDQVDEISSSLRSISFATIFFSKVEMEIIRILQRIANTVQKSLENIRSSLASRQSAFSSKRLRSRQRESYVKQVMSMPSLVAHLLVIVQMVLFVFSVSDRWRPVDSSLSSSLKTLLRKVLKTTENFVTFTDSSVNKYHEALEILRENTKRVNIYFIDSAKDE